MASNVEFTFQNSVIGSPLVKRTSNHYILECKVNIRRHVITDSVGAISSFYISETTDQKEDGTLDDRRRDGGTNSTLRTKEQGTHLTLNGHDDDDLVKRIYM